MQQEKVTEYDPCGRCKKIKEKHLKRIASKLGHIKLYWPQQLIPDIDQWKHYPLSYVQNSNKEKLLLWYTENFRRQYHFVHKDRRPLFLAAQNECGLQKMVCTAIRPTSVRLPEFKTWEGCANFVADHLNYEPLEKSQLLPDRLSSPTAVMERQMGNIFEYSTLLCSFLIGSGYDAYVVSGYATREFCDFDQTRVVCPYLPNCTKIESETEDDAEPKYVIKSPLNFCSKFLLEMEMKKVREKEEEQRKKEEEERQAIEEFEKPPPDDIFGTRVHSWVVVLPTCMDVQETFFIDPLTGNKCDLSNPNYLGLESMWNHANYWVNLQNCSEGCKKLKFELTDLKCWEHLLPGEPWQARKSDHGDEEVSADTILAEKHLDMPASWVERLEISNVAYENRFPEGSKTVLYKKSKLEKFAPYVQEDGLVTRITAYADYDWIRPEFVYEYYSNRVDCLLEVRRNLISNCTVEVFKRGRGDCLREHSFFLGWNGVEGKRTMLFYHMARHDGLEKLEMDPLYLVQHFQDRIDFLCYRKVDYQPRGQGQMEGPNRNVLKLVEEFHRNPKKNADSDVARRTFAVTDNHILLKFHYAPGKVTAATREFIKPPLTEMTDRLTFNPDLTVGYQTDPTDLPPKHPYLFQLLEEQMKAEGDSILSARQIEEEVSTILQQRSIELCEPQLDVSIFNMEKNELAKENMKNRDKQIRAQDAREVETGVDFLAPYFARIGNPETVSQRQALQIREDCIADFRQQLVSRISKIQGYFDEYAAWQPSS
ncbi:dynein regulatory complex subunit 7 isoform X2 [Zootermopsis nevadensis]|uniref:dynein regulatory complex subunit 7 isoform X2 n=1 Tax=Zootermopsis nevadensis TaxID=136037 RepID=UPI000B8EE1E4|nr:dynein regulatory complex subunit 7 isoform X2 [Zootermopsis nevadensis]